MSAASELMVERTVLQSPRSNRPFLVADPNSVWVVHTGKIDLFLARISNSEPDGPRYPVLRLEQDQAFFGFKISAQIGVFASAVPGTKLACFSFPDLVDAAILSDKHAPLVRILEEWISCFTASLSEVAGPSGPVVTIGTEKFSITTNASQLIVPGDSVIWVSHLRGRSLFLSTPLVPAIDSDVFFPLSKRGWLQTTPGSEIDAIDSLALLRTGQARQALDYFHTIAAAVLTCKRDERLRSEVDRWKARVSSESFQIRAALRRLTLPLQAADPILDRDSPCQDPTFLLASRLRSTSALRSLPIPTC